MAHPRNPLLESLGQGTALFGAAVGSFLVLTLLPFAIYPALPSPVISQRYFLTLCVPAFFAVYLSGKVLAPPNFPSKIRFTSLAIILGMGAVATSALLAEEPLFSLDKSLAWMCGAALFVMLREVGRSYDLFGVFSWVFVAQGAALSGYGIAQHFGFEILPYSEAVQKNAVVATFGHPNYFGSYLGPVFFVCLARSIRVSSLLGRILSLLVALEIACALYFAHSRAVWLGTAFGLGFLALVMVTVGHRGETELAPSTIRRRVAISGGMCFLLILCAFAVPSLRSGIREGGARITQGSQFRSRLFLWKIATRMNDPWLPVGIGAGGFDRAFWTEAAEFVGENESEMYRRNITAMSAKSKTLDVGHVHNDYLQMWLEAGPLALAAHLALVAYLLFFGLHSIWVRGPTLQVPVGERLCRGALLGALVCMSVDSTLGFPLGLATSIAMFWFLCALIEQFIEVPVR